ncbi:6-phosphofructokinase [Spiroplasma endosymbiont of Aspidapion aeneum]|uniref:6-phosphofructokinase n=1 Tax=Spiroplasma endosymbiont of Aspidapion aeneum TaxID=3066276 RepID=UPI003CC79E8A
MIKKIGVLTSGGDAPGMNAAISAVIRRSISKGIKPYIIFDGYKGLIENRIEEATLDFASKIIGHGGTAIGSARLPEFKDENVRKKAITTLKSHEIEALVVIGGDGSYQGAEKLTQMGINCIGIPGTIDNDIVSSDYTIGFDTALNTVVRSIDAIRDTMTSHNRCAVVEIMGNGCGDLTLYGATATGCEVISTRENKLTEDEIAEQVSLLAKQKRRSVIVAVAENIYNDVHGLAKKIENKSGYVTRATVLGHVQRGGTPSAMDRYLAINFGIFAVDRLSEGIGGVYIGICDNKFVAKDIESTLNSKPKDKYNEYKIIREINKAF